MTIDATVALNKGPKPGFIFDGDLTKDCSNCKSPLKCFARVSGERVQGAGSENAVLPLAKVVKSPPERISFSSSELAGSTLFSLQNVKEKRKS